jgi:hypothetical protein
VEVEMETPTVVLSSTKPELMMMKMIFTLKQKINSKQKFILLKFSPNEI